MSVLKDSILFIYTLILFVLHAAAFWDLIESGLNSTFNYSKSVYFLLFITSIQYLDIPFSFFLTRSNPVAVFVQVSGRMLVLYVATQMVGWKHVQFALVGVYLLSELCRGPFYMANCLRMPCSRLTWLRYNAFKVLYPIGFTCEALVFINVFFIANRIPIDPTNPQFLLTLVFAVVFLCIVNFLYGSMSRKAAQKNKTD
uniref:Very-long-chain (3R)-3-hydroxyacyl-CoA dehydratase n=1 Tax=Caenorhabditis tropicalis TaxID=1561998 RepID=A0A1I7TWS0_9PELO